MSQTETLLLILVGFSLAALIFLFLARALWHAGMRIGARRMRRQVPANIAELQSERDSLRGEYARLSQKLGSRLSQAKLQMAEQMAEVSRHRNRLAQTAIDLNNRDAEIERQRLHITSIEEELADRSAKLTGTEQDLNNMRNEAARTEAIVTQLRGEIAALEAVSADLPEATPAAALHGSGLAPDDRLKQRIDYLAGLSQEIAEQRNAASANENVTLLDPLLQEKLEAVARETADLQQELARLDAAWAAKLGDGPDTGAATAGQRPRAVANVISLAQRIRALQKDMAR